MLVHWGVFRHLRKDVGAAPAILICAIALDAVVLIAFLLLKWQADPVIILIAAFGMVVVFSFCLLYTSDAADE